MNKNTRWLLLGGAMGAAAALVSGYGTAIRSWHLRWGATRDELTRPLPFDNLIDRANFFATRAITVDASPDDIWPFLTDEQMLPAGTVARRADAKRWIVLAPPEIAAEATWVVALFPMENGRTRVVSRTRARFPNRLAAILRYLVVDPAQFVIERNWLLNIKARAEELAAISNQEMQVAELVP